MNLHILSPYPLCAIWKSLLWHYISLLAPFDSKVDHPLVESLMTMVFSADDSHRLAGWRMITMTTRWLRLTGGLSNKAVRIIATIGHASYRLSLPCKEAGNPMQRLCDRSTMTATFPVLNQLASLKRLVICRPTLIGLFVRWNIQSGSPQWNTDSHVEPRTEKWVRCYISVRIFFYPIRWAKYLVPPFHWFEFATFRHPLTKTLT